MKEFQLVIDLVLDNTDLLRLDNSKPGYLYTTRSNSLYLKHLNHLDYHFPNIVISYGKENHEIIHLPTMRRRKFMINHEELDEFYSVAMGVTDHLAMIAIGDTDHTRLQVIDVDQPLKVFLNTTYMEDDTSFFPVPRYFTGNPSQAVLIYSDSSRLPIDLEEFTISQRIASNMDRIVRSKTVLSPHLNILGPFILLTISKDMSPADLESYRILIEKAAENDWIAVDSTTVINQSLVTTTDFDDVIAQRKKQINRLLELVPEYSEDV